ncbi:FMN-dependent NADH-azoreductase [Mycoplasma nasistruthionis]|uniref:FMN-dependent NADH-azoreductase n=1 Tax=Mycoplasma nasistruthionis TaxID=353852 RepID=A0A5B7XVR4_9MOLU|nr:FMN-dependent NADH-azoreductase [Mycoplasma nasistruthionis]QCZ36535.1 FMN-dependent NADH-azoreductase [Mycoplasma nasistruthionis]
MKKVLLLDSHLVADSVSYTHNILASIEQKVKAKGYDVTKYDLNETHGHTFLTSKNFPAYYQEIDSDKWINLLKETDTLVITMPMINFGPTAVVKNFIDSISVANKTFSYKYSKKGDAIGFLTNLKVVIVASQGAPEGWYTWGNHVSWLEGTFKFLGVKEVEVLRHFGTKVAPLSETSPQDTPQLIEEKINKIVESI